MMDHYLGYTGDFRLALVSLSFLSISEAADASELSFIKEGARDACAEPHQNCD